MGDFGNPIAPHLGGWGVVRVEELWITDVAIFNPLNPPNGGLWILDVANL